jgi:hypothetical protein
MNIVHTGFFWEIITYEIYHFPLYINYTFNATLVLYLIWKGLLIIIR